MRRQAPSTGRLDQFLRQSASKCGPAAAWLWRRRLWVALATVVLVPVLLWVRWLRSPERVAGAAVEALNRADAEDLVRLASRKERELLNLTPETVRAYLQQTWLSGVGGRQLRLLPRSERHYRDVVIYFCECRGGQSEPREYHFTVYQDERGAWRLALSQVLLRLVAVSDILQKGEVDLKRWASIAQSVGILGAISITDGNTLRWSADGGRPAEKRVLLTRPP